MCLIHRTTESLRTVLPPWLYRHYREKPSHLERCRQICSHVFVQSLAISEHRVRLRTCNWMVLCWEFTVGFDTVWVAEQIPSMHRAAGQEWTVIEEHKKKPTTPQEAGTHLEYCSYTEFLVFYPLLYDFFFFLKENQKISSSTAKSLFIWQTLICCSPFCKDQMGNGSCTAN